MKLLQNPTIHYRFSKVHLETSLLFNRFENFDICFFFFKLFLGI